MILSQEATELLSRVAQTGNWAGAERRPTFLPRILAAMAREDEVDALELAAAIRRRIEVLESLAEAIQFGTADNWTADRAFLVLCTDDEADCADLMRCPCTDCREMRRAAH